MFVCFVCLFVCLCVCFFKEYSRCFSRVKNYFLIRTNQYTYPNAVTLSGLCFKKSRVKARLRVHCKVFLLFSFTLHRTSLTTTMTTTTTASKAILNFYFIKCILTLHPTTTLMTSTTFAYQSTLCYLVIYRPSFAPDFDRDYSDVFT